jgi:hypothetical protein
MKMTRWFIEYETQYGWIPYNRRVVSDSETDIISWYLQQKPKREPYRATSYEVEICAKKVVEVHKREVELDILGDYWRRTEYSSTRIEWRKFDKYAPLHCTGWEELTYVCLRGEWQGGEEPEVEQIWREYNE